MSHEQNSFKRKENSCHKKGILAKKGISRPMKELPATGAKFLLQERSFCFRKKILVKGGKSCFTKEIPGIGGKFLELIFG